MNNVSFGVVILNYNEYTVTIKCVESFLKQARSDFTVRVVIVDNGSTNNSYMELKRQFSKEKKVFIIKSYKNLGFAKGNNYGYKFLSEKAKMDFVIFSNSDISFPQTGLYDWVIDCCQKYNFSVLGPSIYSVGGKFYQNPLKNYTTDISKVKKQYAKMHISLMKIWIKKIFRLRNNKLTNRFDTWDTPNKISSKNKTLHGSFQVFAQKYFDYYDEPYDGRTFLYMEEYILKLRCEKKHLNMVYDPNYEVFHQQSFSTRKISKNQNKLDYFRALNIMRSTKVYLDILKEYKNDRNI